MVVSVSIVILFSIFYGVYINALKRDFDKTRDQPGINSQRDRIEKQIYNSEAKLMEDSHNFLDSNKLLIHYASHSPFKTKVPNFSFFQGLGIDYTTIVVDWKKAFCLMPFNESFDTLYNSIKKTCVREEVTCIRSDEEIEPGNLLKQIVEGILTSHLIFAVLDGRNPNVFYEVGLCHAMGKPVYLLAHSNQKDEIPFDLSFSRLVLYNNLEDLESKLARLIDHTLKTDGQIDKEKSC